MKKIILGFVLGAFFFSGISYAATGDLVAKISGYKIFVDGKEKATKNKLVTINGTTYVQLSELSSILGYYAKISNGKIELSPTKVKTEDTKKVENTTNFTFRNTTWGMSNADVLKSEVGTPINPSKNNLLYKDKIAGLDVYILYYFSNDKLYEVFVRVSNEYPDSKLDQLVPDYTLLEQAITNKYGKAFWTGADWSDKSKILEYENNSGKAIKIGYLHLLTKWSNTDTLIDQGLYGENEKLQFGITFSSRKYKDSLNGL